MNWKTFLFNFFMKIDWSNEIKRRKIYDEIIIKRGSGPSSLFKGVNKSFWGPGSHFFIMSTVHSF